MSRPSSSLRLAEYAQINSARSDVVFCIGDEYPRLREFFTLLISSVNMQIEIFGSINEYLAQFDAACSGCVVLHLVDEPETAVNALIAHEVQLPIIAIVSSPQNNTATLRSQVYQVIEKPFDPPTLLESIQKAVVSQVRRRASSEEIAVRLESLTSRENRILKLLVEGKTPEAIARQMRFNRIILNFQVESILRKMGIRSTDELVKLILLVRDQDRKNIKAVPNDGENL